MGSYYERDGGRSPPVDQSQIDRFRLKSPSPPRTSLWMNQERDTGTRGRFMTTADRIQADRDGTRPPSPPPMLPWMRDALNEGDQASEPASPPGPAPQHGEAPATNWRRAPIPIRLGSTSQNSPFSIPAPPLKRALFRLKRSIAEGERPRAQYGENDYYYYEPADGPMGHGIYTASLNPNEPDVVEFYPMAEIEDPWESVDWLSPANKRRR